MELEQYADRQRVVAALYQIRYIGNDCTVDLPRNALFRLLLAQ